MKKRLFTLILTFALLLTMTACSTANALQTLDAAEDRVEDKLDAVEDRVENALRQTVAPAPAAEPTKPTPTPTDSSPSAPASAQEPAATISQEEAEKIALDHVGFTADQVQQIRTGYEIDDRVPQYDVEFHEGDWEYEFEIHAETGKILSYDKDHRYD